jgi:ADP-ribosylglycohydrolase
MNTDFPPDFLECTYAGVLGKLIGVYLGRPIEGWTFEHITAQFGEVRSYLHEARGLPLVVTDDDVTGTFAFARAMTDYDCDPGLTPAQIGQTWLNTIIENKTTLWWGGVGNSTEHTAYLRLARGISAPDSGSSRLNTVVVSEQIGAQIFVDGWAMMAPGDPILAADFARRAGSVSHDGEALHAAAVIAAMEAQAFVERDIDKLLETGLSVIPADCLIATLIRDLRSWHASEPDWRVARQHLERDYGYERFGGDVHVVPNHGLIILALLYGEGDFGRSMMIVNTSGWDTDCNAGNLGCLLGIRGGLPALETGVDWRTPVADRLFLPGPDGDRFVTDALTETYHLVNAARRLRGLEALHPKNGARFHFSLPGSVQGFQTDNAPEARGMLHLENAPLGNTRALAMRYPNLESGRVARAYTQTFLPPEIPLTPTPGVPNPWKYQPLGAPSLYPGQTVRATLEANIENRGAVTACLYLRRYDVTDHLERVYGPQATLEPGMRHDLTWTLEGGRGEPIAEIGVELRAESQNNGCVFLDRLGWDGEPDVILGRPVVDGAYWRRAWVEAVDRADRRYPEDYRIVQNRGTGLLLTGSRRWRDYQVSATLEPALSERSGLAVRVQGLKRYYALMFSAEGELQLLKVLDGDTVLARADHPWQRGKRYALRLEARGARIRAFVDGRLVFDVTDETRPLLEGGVALTVSEGRLSSGAVRVQPLRENVAP